jgi:DNA-binding transcriptional MerR regulator
MRAPRQRQTDWTRSGGKHQVSLDTRFAAADHVRVDGYPLRMRDLVQRTGLPAPTIHFYAQQGLLPASRKTAGNQARYGEQTLERLLWIRSLQNELRLPLRSIRWILGRWGELPVAEIRTLQTLGRLLDEPDPAADAVALDAIRERLEPGDLDSLRRLGLIAAGAPISSSDLRLLEVCAAMRAAGFTEAAGFSMEQIALYRDAVERLVTEELQRIVEPILDRHSPDGLRDLVRRGLPFTNQMLSLLHERAVQAELQRWLEIAEPVPHATTA